MRKFHILLSFLLIVFLTACGQGSDLITDTDSIMSYDEIRSVSRNCIALPTIPEETVAEEETAELLMVKEGSHQLSYTCDVTRFPMQYYLHVPEDAVEGMPLIVFLHGMCAVDEVSMLEDYGPIVKARQIYGEAFPFIILSPCTWTTSWTAPHIADTLLSLIDHIADAYCVDRNRIVITGHSLGAVGVWHMAAAYTDYFQAAIPVSGSPPSKYLPEECIGIPIRAFVGDTDPYEPGYGWHMGKCIEEINVNGGDASLTVLEGLGHDDTVTETYTEALFNWILDSE